MAVQLRNNDGYTWHVQTKRNNIQKNTIGTLGSSSGHISYQFFFCFLKEMSSSTIFLSCTAFLPIFSPPPKFVRGATSRAANFTLEDFNDFCCSFTAKRDATIMIGKLNLPGVQKKNCPGQASFNVSLKSNGQNKNKKNPGS